MAKFQMSPTSLNQYGQYQMGWLHQIQRNCRPLFLVILCILLGIPLVAHYYISNYGTETADGDVHRSRKLDHADDLTSIKVADLKFRIEELKRIKASVSNELRELESKRQKLHAEIGGYTTQLDKLKSDFEKSHVELQQLKATIENTKLEQEELIQRSTPEIFAPKRVLPGLVDSVSIPPPGSPQSCQMHSCFDYSRCSVTSQFPVYFYDPNDFHFTSSQLENFVKFTVTHALNASPHITYDPHIACVYIVLLGETPGGPGNASQLERKLYNLPYWHGDGRNHILVNLARSYVSKDIFYGVNTGRALIVQSAFLQDQFRRGFDILAPPMLGISHGDVWDQMAPISPARRKYILSFQGEYPRLAEQPKQTAAPPRQVQQPVEREVKVAEKVVLTGDPIVGKSKLQSNLPNNLQTLRHKSVRKNLEPPVDHVEGLEISEEQDGAINVNKGHNPNIRHPGHRLTDADYVRSRRLQGVDSVVEGNVDARFNTHSYDDAQELLTLDRSIVDTLKRMQSVYPDAGFNFQFSCKNERIFGVNGEWALCGPDAQRHMLLQQSTFSLILAPTNFSVVSTVLTQVRVYEALQFGAIPVILGDHVHLPFLDVLRWHNAIIVLPKPRVTELHFVVQSMADNDILALRRHGRFLWESYFGSTKSIMDMVLAILRTRLNIPAFPIREEQSPSVFNSSFVPLQEEVVELPPEAEEVLGPMEAPLSSPRFRRNYTHTLDIFNVPGDPFHLYPFTPTDPLLPAEAKFLGSGLGFRPIGKGAGGAGKEFNEALGGNNAREQFTVVMLTYEREAVLINAIRRLKGLPHLNKVIVVWNSPNPPPEELKWPDIGVKIHVVKTAKNSLNNRFLPYDAIETEAILSIDDDAHLRHDEITFGFRVWREARDRIVGFPGRFHAWDLKHQSWLYNSNHSCELSMVLTGAAFFHKYYAYLYSYIMPQAIREKVDEYMNCEDLAMNFLVSHITQKPPIKVTSRWTFRCPGCPQALSEDDSHFQERHKCLNFFTQVYGYMPLLNTQFRVDSVLFKTRIPHDKQKCFKFI